jgi:hypothetical protein
MFIGFIDPLQLRGQDKMHVSTVSYQHRKWLDVLSCVNSEYAVGTLQTRYPRVQVPGQDKRRDMQITRSCV